MYSIDTIIFDKSSMSFELRICIHYNTISIYVSYRFLNQLKIFYIIYYTICLENVGWVCYEIIFMNFIYYICIFSFRTIKSILLLLCVLFPVEVKTNRKYTHMFYMSITFYALTVEHSAFLSFLNLFIF